MWKVIYTTSLQCILESVLLAMGDSGSVVHAGYIFRHDAPNPNESELSYLYDESVGVKDIDEGVRMQKGG